MSELGEAKHTPTSRFADVREAPSQKPKPAPQPPVSRGPQEDKYPRWAVTLFVVGFCAAFWGGVIWLAMGLFS